MSKVYPTSSQVRSLSFDRNCRVSYFLPSDSFYVAIAFLDMPVESVSRGALVEWFKV